MNSTDLISIEVVFATPGKQLLLELRVSEGTSVYDAAEQSAISAKFPEIDLENMALGIFGKVVRQPKSQAVKAGDRIEIYRPVTKGPAP